MPALLVEWLEPMLELVTSINKCLKTISIMITMLNLNKTKEEKEQTHISESLIRISVGLENIEDIIDDIRP